MKVTLTTSTAARVAVWKEDDLYHARRADTPEQPQVCLAVDLFEVIAELGGLNLEDAEQAAEATSLAARAQAQLNELSPEADGDQGGNSANRSSVP